jgi:hypothetical protein
MLYAAVGFIGFIFGFALAALLNIAHEQNDESVKREDEIK